LRHYNKKAMPGAQLNNSDAALSTLRSLERTGVRFPGSRAFRRRDTLAWIDNGRVHRTPRRIFGTDQRGANNRYQQSRQCLRGVDRGIRRSAARQKLNVQCPVTLVDAFGAQQRLNQFVD
jgi:hypothetical protein